jgi:hypothetical protein
MEFFVAYSSVADASLLAELMMVFTYVFVKYHIHRHTNTLIPTFTCTHVQLTFLSNLICTRFTIWHSSKTTVYYQEFYLLGYNAV